MLRKSTATPPAAPVAEHGREDRAFTVGDDWYARTPEGTVGPMSFTEVEEVLDLLDKVAAARGEIPAG